MRIRKGLPIKLVLMLAALIAASSCWHEAQKECDSYISFRYIYNIAGENLFHKEVGRVQLLLFDDAGIYRGQAGRTADGDLFSADYKLALPKGMYDVKRIVTLGGEYGSAFTIAPATLVAGSTSIGDITLTVKPLTGTERGMPGVFHGGRIKGDRITPGDAIGGTAVDLQYYDESHEVELMKISKVFRILLRVTENGEPMSGDTFDFEITAPNSVLDLNAEPVGSAAYRYTPYLTEDVEGTNYHAGEIWTPRLKAGAEQVLTVKQNVAPYAVAFEEDLNELLYAVMLQAEEEGAEDFQEFLDRKDRFVITLILKKMETIPGETGYVSSQITIDEWIVRDNSVEP